MPPIPVLVSEANYKLENFRPPEEMQARAAVQEVRMLAQLIDRAVMPASLGGTKIIVRTALADWFGVNDDAGYRELKGKLNQLNRTALTGNVTLVYRPDIVVKDAAGAPAMLGPGNPFVGGTVYGYVHHHTAGSGYRVICGKLFITDPTPYYASTTIYHELSHKVLHTRDIGYGDANCKLYAQQGLATAIANADNYAYFAIALGKNRARI